MKFSTREDIAAPIDRVFEELSDFSRFERAILRRGADVARTDTLDRPGPGMCWVSRFTFRGKPREIRSELVEHQAPEKLRLLSRSDGLEGQMSVDLVQLSPRQTRVFLNLDLKPNTLSSRLFLQSLRLAKATLTRRFKTGLHDFARDIERRRNGPA